MAIKDSTSSAEDSTPVSVIRQLPIDAGMALQKELLDAYEKAGCAWLARVKSEVLWSELAAKLTTVRSVPEAVEAYTKNVSQRMQMTADDGQRLFHECEEITQKITKQSPMGGSLLDD